MTVSIARCQAELSGLNDAVVSTTRPLIGTCRAAEAGSRNTSSATPSDTATSTATVNAFHARASPIAKARRTPSTTATLRWIAARTDDRTETWTTTRAVSGARTGSGTPVTNPAIHHARPAATPDLATTPISVDVGRVHETAPTTRCHSGPTRPAEGCVATIGLPSRFRGVNRRAGGGCRR